jgi:hypothetical protein
LFDEHGPIQVVDGVRCVVPGESVTAAATRLLRLALHGLTWMVMAGGRIDVDLLVPPGFAAAGVFENVSTGEELMAVLAQSFPYLARDGFVRL